MTDRLARCSPHAADRARQMGVPIAEVLDVLLDPELDYPAPPEHQHTGRPRRIAAAGRLEVPYHVTSTGEREAVTVLWRGQDHR